MLHRTTGGMPLRPRKRDAGNAAIFWSGFAFLVNISLEFDVLPLASMQASASCACCDLEAVSTQLHAAPAPRPFLADVMEVQHTLITCGCGCAPRWRITIKPLELLVAGGAIRRCARDSESLASNARAGLGHDLLGCELFQRAIGVENILRAPRPVLHPQNRQISEGTYLDEQDSAS